MSAFVLGIILGCFLGAVGTLLLLLIVDSIPDGDYLDSGTRVPKVWWDAGLIIALIIASGSAFSFLNLRQVSFATSLLLLLVFLAARLRGMLISWMSLSVATLVLCLLLSPGGNLSISDWQDRMLVAFFVLCGAVGTRLISRTQAA